MFPEERDKYLYLLGKANGLPVGVAETGMNVSAVNTERPMLTFLRKSTRSSLV